MNMVKIDGCNITTAISIDKIKENVKCNVDNRLNVFFLEDWRIKPIALVGGGPSLKTQLDTLQQFNKIIACGSVHDYLVTNNIKFEYCIVCDPDPLVINYIKYPQKGVKYLIATQCDPSVFEYLYGYNVYAWHAQIGEKDDNHLFKNEPSVGGGCTVGTRAIIMAMSFGYSDIHLFGYDTCLDGHYNHHAYEFSDPNIETIGNIQEIKLDNNENGKTFKVAGYMLGQFFDFQEILKEHSTRVRFTVHGDGLLRELLKLSLEKAKELVK